jgi:hypothetical protein
MNNVELYIWKIMFLFHYFWNRTIDKIIVGTRSYKKLTIIDDYEEHQEKRRKNYIYKCSATNLYHDIDD